MRLATALLGLVAMLALQGCVLTRILETRSQLCDEQPPRVSVARQAGRGIRVLFATPTLTDRDVAWIVGYEPTRDTGPNDIREFFYEAVPLGRPLDRDMGLVVRLSFKRLAGEYRLAEVEIPEMFNAILPQPLLEAGVGVVCKTQIGIVPPSTTFDLTSIDRATLPRRETLTRLLGAPTAAIARPGEVGYAFCLAPCDARASMVASLRFSFSGDGELKRADATYFRYSAFVDLVSARPTATVALH